MSSNTNVRSYGGQRDDSLWSRQSRHQNMRSGRIFYCLFIFVYQVFRTEVHQTRVKLINNFPVERVTSHRTPFTWSCISVGVVTLKWGKELDLCLTNTSRSDTQMFAEGFVFVSIFGH